MEYTRLGATDLEVSRLGLGTVQLGMPYGLGLPAPPDDEQCLALLHRCRDQGITYFDTAAAYGRSEEILGKAFPHKAKDGLIIATKVTLSPDNKPPRLSGAPLRQHLENSLRQSIARLGRDPLDLVQFHNAGDDFAGDDLTEMADDFTRRGLVRYWGATTYGDSAPLQALQWPRLQTLQVAYSALDRRMAQHVFPRCKARNAGLILRSVFLKGILSRAGQALPPPVADDMQSGSKQQQG